MHRLRPSGVRVVLLLSLLAGPTAVAPAAPPRVAPPTGGIVADVPANKDWDVDDRSATFTGGGHGPATIQLVLDKVGVSGRPLSVQSDGGEILIGGMAPGDVNIGLAVDRAEPGAPAGDGVVSTLLLVGGDHPSISFDGHESIRENGHWRRLAHGPGGTITLAVANATFAVVKFTPPVPPPVAAAPVPSARAPAPVAAAPVAAGLPRLRPARVAALARAFADAVAKPCPTCRGTGQVVRQAQVGSQKQGIFSVPVMESVTQNCTRCDHGLIHGSTDVLLRQTANLARGLIAINLTSPDAQPVLKDTYDTIAQNAIGDYRAWSTLTKDARSTLSVATPRIGTALIAEVFVDKAWTDASGHRIFRAHLPGTTNSFVILDPPTADNVKVGPVLMGGLIDHPAAAADMAADDELQGANSTAIRGAFVIAPNIDRRWTWWSYRDAYRAAN